MCATSDIGKSLNPARLEDMDPDSKVREVFAFACDLDKEARRETLEKFVRTTPRCVTR